MSGNRVAWERLLEGLDHDEWLAVDVHGKHEVFHPGWRVEDGLIFGRPNWSEAFRQEKGNWPYMIVALGDVDKVSHPSTAWPG